MQKNRISFSSAFFQLLRNSRELRKLILDAFENNDDAVINAIASECCTEKTEIGLN